MPVIDAVAVVQQLSDRCLGGKDIAGLAVGEALVKVGRKVEPPEELLLGHPVGLGGGGRHIFLTEDLPAKAFVQLLGQSCAAAAGPLDMVTIGMDLEPPFLAHRWKAGG